MDTDQEDPQKQPLTRAQEKLRIPGDQEQQPPGVERKLIPQADHGEKTYKGADKLKGKVAIVTGGDSGIGRAVCIAFAREGADVVVSYLNEHEDAKETERWVKQAGRQCVLVSGDISEEAQCRKIIDETVKAFGQFDILVNNAAFQGKQVKSIEELDEERVLHTFKTNIISMFSLCRLGVPHMREGGSVINTGSIQAYNPNPGIMDYAATKGAITTFTKGMASELIKKGIRVNCVAPGPIWTPLVAASFPSEKLEKFGENTPTGRPGMPSEVAPCFVFLASQDSRYVNAEVLGVTGGRPLG